MKKLIILFILLFVLPAWGFDIERSHLDGEYILNDTIDDDSIDFTDVTCVDMTMTDCGAITTTNVFTNSNSAIACSTNVCTDVATAYAVYITTESDATPDVLAIADGVAGQEKLIVLKGAGTDDLTITPANYASGTSITCTTTGFSAKLHFDGTNWQVVALFGCTDD